MCCARAVPAAEDGERPRAAFLLGLAIAGHAARTRRPLDGDTSSVLTHHLAAGHPPADALWPAQLDLLDPTHPALPGLHPHLAALDRANLTHPASWSGFVHHGC